VSRSLFSPVGVAGVWPSELASAALCSSEFRGTVIRLLRLRLSVVGVLGPLERPNQLFFFPLSIVSMVQTTKQRKPSNGIEEGVSGARNMNEFLGLASGAVGWMCNGCVVAIRGCTNLIVRTLCMLEFRVGGEVKRAVQCLRGSATPLKQEVAPPPSGIHYPHRH
jgi:hypothetical protein